MSASAFPDHLASLSDPVVSLSDLEFSFDSSDLDLLPDLTDDASVCSATVVTPTKAPSLEFFDRTRTQLQSSLQLKELKSYDQSQYSGVNELAASSPLESPFGAFESPFSSPFPSLSATPVVSRNSSSAFASPAARPQETSPQLSIFDIPELVYKIVEYADFRNTVIPHETPPTDRNPTGPPPAVSASSDPNILFVCLQVNRLFHTVTKQIMGQRLCFAQEHRLYQFLRQKTPESLRALRPRKLVLNRLFGANQAAMDALATDVDFSALEWLEVFMCPKLLPSESLLHPSLKTLIIAGSRVLDDALLLQVARRCPNLEVLDLRACESVTDYGIHAFGSACRNLRSVNLGRKKRGHLITDHSVCTLISHNRKLHTVGLAGCHVTDRTVWELAVRGGSALQRLLLNHCPYVTNRSLPVILHHELWRNLSVLEMCGLEAVTNVSPIVTFKRKQHARGIYLLVETCAELKRRMQQVEHQMDSTLSHRIFQDISDWANAHDEEDLAYSQLMSSRLVK